MNKKISLKLTAVIIAIILSFTINVIVEAGNKYSYDSDKENPESTNVTLKRSIYYEKETVDLLKEIRDQLVLEEKESIKLLREIRDMLKKNGK